MREPDNTGVPSDRAIAWLLTAIVLLGAGLRIHFADSALWYDELVTLTESVRAPFAAIVTEFPSNNNHVLYSLLARASVILLGEQPWSVRLPAVLFGIASIPMLYLLGARVAGRFEALWATLLLAVSYHAIWFSQNARGYTILLFCALLSTHLLLAGLRDNRRSAWLLYGIVAALSAYTHLTMVLFVVGQAGVVGWHLLRGTRAFNLRDWTNPALGFVVAGIVTLGLYAPMLGDVQAFFGREPRGAAVATAGWAVAETLRGLQLGYAAGGAIVVGGALLVIGVWSYLRRGPLTLALFVVPGAVLFLATVLLRRPTFPRFFFFLAGFALLILVRGAVVCSHWFADHLPADAAGRQRWRAILPVVALAGMAVVSGLALPGLYRHPKQDYDGALQFVESSAGARDLVVVAGGGTAVPYRDYYRKPWQRVASAAELERLRTQHDRVWLLYTFSRYIETLEPELMNEIRARCTMARTFPGTVAGGEIVVARCGAS